jgi:hypothetical protein
MENQPRINEYREVAEENLEGAKGEAAVKASNGEPAGLWRIGCAHCKFKRDRLTLAELQSALSAARHG